jgi:hypothetical protein
MSVRRRPRARGCLSRVPRRGELGVGVSQQLLSRDAARHAGEQYAWSRSLEGQIAKRRLQRRQTFWRSGASTTSERQRASTGHGAQIVAQERRPARSVGASRRSPRVWGISSRPSSHVAATCSLRDPRAIAQSEEAVDAAGAWTHRTRPQRLGKPAHNAGFPQASTATFSFHSEEQEPKTRSRSAGHRPNLRGFS